MPFGANSMVTIASAPSKIRYQVQSIRKVVLQRVREKKLGSRTSPFTRFGIQLYYALLTAIPLRHRQLHHVEMIKSSDALFIGYCARLRQGGA
jgi:hypothetical protein